MMAREAFLFHHCCSCFVPTACHIPKHLTHHPILRQRALTHSAAAHLNTHGGHTHTHTHTHTQRLRNTHAASSLLNKLVQDLATRTVYFFFFHDLVTCSYVSSFHHSTKHPGSLYPCLQQHLAKAFGVFLYGYKWVVRASVHPMLLRVKSTALGVIH